ncbi:hypothetical protein HF290_02450 [Acidithiobacillus ferrooxidans]|jgi:hypothetical protein|uniref:hypothetical protein n=1 Tax=Acidithiobacillus ferrooxidans TaxID=920 RepID=UPI001C072D6F|nr:hypothetical protein [Acidithiobacillus ferrooxidans]MBU2859312.1 hypothetical protein [Acidithiobacillus ferrooxidans]
MNESQRKDRINALQSHRHALLQKRDIRGASIASIDMELNVVRSELQALYETGRKQRQPEASDAVALDLD